MRSPPSSPLHLGSSPIRICPFRCHADGSRTEEKRVGELDGKIAVITGAGSGMAKASAEVFVREGAKVLAADISGAEKDTAAELGEPAVPFHVDVSNEADVEAMFSAAVEAFGRVDAVLNVAGIGSAGAVHEITL